MIKLSGTRYVAPEEIHSISLEYIHSTWHVYVELKGTKPREAINAGFFPISEELNDVNDARKNAEHRAAEIAIAVSITKTRQIP